MNRSASLAADSGAGRRTSARRFSPVATLAGCMIPLLLVAGLLLPWSALLGVAALPTLPIMGGALMASGRARWRLVAVGLLASSLLAAGAWVMRGSEFGSYTAVYFAIPILPLVVGPPIAATGSLPPSVRGLGFGFGLSIGAIPLGCPLLLLDPLGITITALVSVVAAAAVARSPLRPRLVMSRPTAPRHDES